MAKHIANINNNIVSIDASGILTTPGINTAIINHPTQGVGSNGEYIQSDGAGGWSWTTPPEGGLTAGTGINITDSVIHNTAPDQTVSLTGIGDTSVTGIYPNFTISSTDTTYTQGTGVTINGSNQISIGQSVGTTDDVEFNSIQTAGMSNSGTLTNTGILKAPEYQVNSSDNNLSMIDKTYANTVNYDFVKGIVINGTGGHSYFRTGVCRDTNANRSFSQIYSSAFLQIYGSESISYQVGHDHLFYTSLGRSIKLNGTNIHTASSDDRIKFNETLVENGLDVINQVNIYKYDKVYQIGDTPENDPYKKEVGVIAQEIQQIPELAQSVCVNEVPERMDSRFPNGVPMSVYYDQIHSYHIKATQELHALVKILEARIKVLETK